MADRDVQEAQDAFKEADAKRDEKILARALEDFEEARSAGSENFQKGLDDLRFARLGEQWDEAVREARERANRPVITVNRLNTMVNLVVNDAKMNTPEIKVRPVDDEADILTADIITGLMRNIASTSSADTAYDTALESAVTTGVGYFRIDIVDAHDDYFEKDIKILPIYNRFSIYEDPYAKDVTGEDWEYCFATSVLPKRVFERKYRGAEGSGWGGGYEALESPWADGDSIMLAEYWTREETEKTVILLQQELAPGVIGKRIVVDMADYESGLIAFENERFAPVGTRKVVGHKVTQRIMSGAEVLETVEWPGRWIPIVPVYGIVINENGKRHYRSLVHDAKEQQRLVNVNTSVAVEYMAMQPKAPWIGPEGTFDPDPGWQTANTENHAFLEYDARKGRPERVFFTGPASGAVEAAMRAEEQMKATLGIYDSALGARSNETSGVAINSRKRQTSVATYHFTDNQEKSIRHGGRIQLDLIPSIYSGGRVIRTLGPDGVPANVRLEPGQRPDPALIQQIQEGQAKRQSALTQVYDLSVGKYDLVIDTGPSYATAREERAEVLMELVRAYPPLADVAGDLIVKSLDFPGAEELSDRIRSMREEMTGKAREAERQQVMQAMDGLKGELAKAQDKSALEAAKLDIERQKVTIQGYAAETGRLGELAPAIPMAMVQAVVAKAVQELLTTPHPAPPPPPPAPPMPPMMAGPGGLPGLPPMPGGAPAAPGGGVIPGAAPVN